MTGDSVPSGLSGAMLGEAPLGAVSNETVGTGWITPDRRALCGNSGWSVKDGPRCHGWAQAARPRVLRWRRTRHAGDVSPSRLSTFRRRTPRRGRVAVDGFEAWGQFAGTIMRTAVFRGVFAGIISTHQPRPPMPGA